jgi:hypothetical protein
MFTFRVFHSCVVLSTKNMVTNSKFRVVLSRTPASEELILTTVTSEPSTYTGFSAQQSFPEADSVVYATP